MSKSCFNIYCNWYLTTELDLSFYFQRELDRLILRVNSLKHTCIKRLFTSYLNANQIQQWITFLKRRGKRLNNDLNLRNKYWKTQLKFRIRKVLQFSKLNQQFLDKSILIISDPQFYTLHHKAITWSI